MIFFLYGILTPVYKIVLNGKLSKPNYFLLAWTSAPHFIAYAYLYQYTVFIVITIISQIINLILVRYNRLEILWSGVTLIVYAIIMLFIYYLLF